MDLVEVDTKLFITCRLCLEDMGVYQLMPKIQEQIKFCFDIEVKLFDGLPQLICKKCSVILTDFYNLKTSYIEKQKSLKAEYQTKNETVTTSSDPPQQGTVSSSQQYDNETCSLPQETPLKVQKKRKHLFSSSTSGDDADCTHTLPTPTAENIKLKRRPSTPPAAFRTFFDKYYVCTFCKKRYTLMGNMRNHLKTHEKLASRLQHVLKRACTVKLIKIDGKPNVTGMPNTVVHNPTKIISNDLNMNYYIRYSLKQDSNRSNTPNYGEKKLDQSMYLDSSDEDIFVKRTRSKRTRLLSRSSNETVVLEGHTKNAVLSDNEGVKRTVTKFREVPLNDTECINIDDSSDAGSCKSNPDLNSCPESKEPLKAKFMDYKKIQNIISVSKNKYSKKIESSENDATNTEYLTHKILNIGRKVINKQGFNCTGLLRFMEYRNLEITWKPTNSTSASGNKENLVRIMTTTRDKKKGVTDNSGWKNVPGNRASESSDEEAKESGESYIYVDQINSTTSNVESVALENTNTKNRRESGKLNGHSKEHNSLAAKSADHAEIHRLLPNNDHDVNSKNKHLLNASPVANPKKLPKKVITTEIKSNAHGEEALQNIKETGDSLYIYLGSNTEECMPIITSTTSLAPPPLPNDVLEKINDTINDVISNTHASNDSEKSTPRIKVKPASELMSARVLQNLNCPNNIWGQNQSANATAPCQNTVSPSHVAMPSQPQYGYPLGQPSNTLQMIPIQNASVVDTQQIMSAPPSQANDNECQYVILHTAELPNTRTNSPFRYLKQLLYIHNIILMEANETLSNFVCLIKFKLQYNQDTVAHSVVLYLTLLCQNNKFCLGVKFHGQESNIDVKKLSINWQWEIINKIYQGEVFHKILKNAQLVNQTVFEYTKSFLCLIKSIQLKRDDSNS